MLILYNKLFVHLSFYKTVSFLKIVNFYTLSALPDTQHVIDAQECLWNSIDLEPKSFELINSHF